MARKPPEPGAGREALLVWLKLAVLLLGLAAVGLITFWLSHMLHRPH